MLSLQRELQRGYPSSAQLAVFSIKIFLVILYPSGLKLSRFCCVVGSVWLHDAWCSSGCRDVSLHGSSGKAVRAQMQSCHVGLLSVWDRDSCLGMELASGTGDLWMGEAWGPAGGTGRHQPDETANPLGPIPFRQTLLSGVIYLSPNLLSKKWKFITSIYTGRINGEEQPSLWHCCKFARPPFFFFPLLHLARLPMALSSGPGVGKGEPAPSTLRSLEAICSRNCKTWRSCPYKLFTRGSKRSRKLLGFLAKPRGLWGHLPAPTRFL